MLNLTYFETSAKSKLCFFPSPLQQSHHVFGEQKQPGDGDVSVFSPRTSGQEQPEVTTGRRRELWGAASATGHLRQERDPEAAAVCSSALRTVRHPHWGLCPSATRGWVWLLTPIYWHDISLIWVLLIIYKHYRRESCSGGFNWLSSMLVSQVTN